MKNIVKYIKALSGKRTITSDLTAGLIFFATLMVIIVGALNYFFTRQQSEKNLNSQADNISQKMAEILSFPVWNFDDATIQKIGQSFLQSEDVAFIRILDENNEVLFENTTEEKDLITSTSSIYYKYHRIGSVEVALSKKSIQDTLSNIFMSTLLTTVIVIITLQLGTSFMLHRFLELPLNALIRGLDAIASGKEHHSIAPVAQTDINKIIQSVNLMARQIDERVEALRQSEERFREVITSINDMVYMNEVLPSGEGINRYRSPNIAVITGYPMEKFKDDWLFWIEHVIHPEDREVAERLWKELVQGKNGEAEYRLIRSNQEVIWVRDNARVVTTGDSKVIYGVVSNITERKLIDQELLKYQEHLEELVFARTEELENLNKELESFAYSISHDLRAPLRHIDGYSYALIEDFESSLPEQAVAYLQRMRKSAQQMSELIDGLLRLSRLTRQPLFVQNVEPQGVIQSVISVLMAEQSGRQIEIHLGELPPCNADLILLRQVYINLISNAIKYTRKQNRAIIEIASFEKEGQQIYYVRDNGVGFDMQYAKKLFGVFQRLHSEKDFEGTGVGLAIVQRIIHRHGGKIWAESEPDKGCTFYFTLNSTPNP